MHSQTRTTHQHRAVLVFLIVHNYFALDDLYDFFRILTRKKDIQVKYFYLQTVDSTRFFFSINP